MAEGTAVPEFTHWVQKALASLYDPSALAGSPLVSLLIARPVADPASAVQRCLLEAIESLRPNQSAPVGSRAWRIYQVLRARYTEQLPQPRVASDLGLSIRQLQREEAIARTVLAEHLWTAHGLEAKGLALAAAIEAHSEPPQVAGPKATDGQELAALATSIPVRVTDVGDILQAALRTISPLSQSAHVTLTCTVQPELPRVALQGPLLRQALLNILEAAIGYARGQQVLVSAGSLNGRLSIGIASLGDRAPLPQPDADYSDDLEQARQLIMLCRGALEVSVPRQEAIALSDGAHRFEVSIQFTAAEQIPILVVDDNADALKLLERYMSGSRFRMLGVQDARRALSMAVKTQPKAVVLDVMMPEEDGWTLLGALREHPKTRTIPVIVCTIMAQKELALALGAAEFMRKPVSQPALLAALGRQIDRVLNTPGSET